jgi:hypothetical protein
MTRLLLLFFAVLSACSEEGYQEGRAGFGAWVIPVPLSIQAERGLMPGEGALVVRVRPGGTAESLGIKPGEVITSINETPISRHRDIRNLMPTIAPGNKAAVNVVGRDGIERQREGEFKQRLPRPNFRDWNRDAWRDMGRIPFMNGDDVVASQYAQLLAEQRALEQAETALRAALATLPDGNDRDWVCNLDIDLN